MSSFITIIKVALQILPFIIEAIKAIEAAMPSGGNGAEKLGVIKETIQTAMNTADQVETTFDAVWPTISAMTSGVVSLFNAGGLFKKST